MAMSDDPYLTQRPQGLHRRSVLRAGVGLGLLAITGCAQGTDDVTAELREATATELKSIAVNWDRPDGTRIKVPVWTYSPVQRGHRHTLMIMHGVNRNAKDYISAWRGLAREHQAMLIAPELKSSDFPTSWGYQQGAIADEDGEPVDQRYWTFELIDRIYQRVQQNMRLTLPHYAMWGHSAGAQFTHRFAMYSRTTNLKCAVACNAGWYTFASDVAPYPYGLRATPAPVDLKRAFARRLTVVTGTDDVEDDENLRHTALADAQGLTRLARGHSFYADAQRVAAASGLDFRWRQQDVANVGHSFTGMIPGSAQYVFSDS